MPSRRRKLRDLAALDVVGGVAAHPDLAAGGALVHVEQLEDRALARAAGPGEEDEFALGDSKLTSCSATAPAAARG